MAIQAARLMRWLSISASRAAVELALLWLLRRWWRVHLRRALKAAPPGSQQSPSHAHSHRKLSLEDEFMLEREYSGCFARQSSAGWARQMSEHSVDKGIYTGSFGSGKESRSGDAKLVIVMVGLPARGKSYITKHLQRYISFEGFGIRVFNAGDYRRKMIGAGQSANFFDPSNAEAKHMRTQVAFNALEALLGWLSNTDSAHVGIFDATNSTRLRRAAVLERCSRVPGIRVAFLESICSDEEVLRKNYEMKLQNADYSTWNPEDARKDFLQRIARYEQEYETVEEDEDDGQVSFMKVLNVGEKTVQRFCHGFLLSKIAGYLLNMHIDERTIFLTRHGESVDNARGRLGGDVGLTAAGTAYARGLCNYMQRYLGWDSEACTKEDTDKGSSPSSSRSMTGEGWLLMTSQLKRTRQTARPLLEDDRFVLQSGMRRMHTAMLNEINSGTYDGYTVQDIERVAPKEHAARKKDKLRYRYPQGESYLDVVQRVRPLAMDIERERRPVLVIAHQAVIRTLLAFFQGTPLEEMPILEIPLHTVLKLSVSGHGCKVELVPLLEQPQYKPVLEVDDLSVNPALKGA